MNAGWGAAVAEPPAAGEATATTVARTARRRAARRADCFIDLTSFLESLRRASAGAITGP
jgi:CRISPR/Cas system Type II protein with McrA/HNH and RuvC-like nuclease domain